MKIKIVIESDNDAFYTVQGCVDEVQRIITDAIDEWAGNPVPVEVDSKLFDVNGNSVGSIEVSDLPLPSTRNEPEIEDRIRSYWYDSDLSGADDLDLERDLETFFEHGHWWARHELKEGSDQPQRTWSVVDVEKNGEHSFDFEEV